MRFISIKQKGISPVLLVILHFGKLKRSSLLTDCSLRVNNYWRFGHETEIIYHDLKQNIKSLFILTTFNFATLTPVLLKVEHPKF